MDSNTRGVIIDMFQLAEKGELAKIEQKHIITALISYGSFLLRNKSYNEIQEEFKRIRVGSRKLLEQTEQCIDLALENLKNTKDLLDSMQVDYQNLPEHAEMGDDKKTIAFIESLNQDLYNFSEAERLTGVTRQTLKKHAKAGLHGLKITKLSKSEYLNKERLIVYYRAKFNDNELPF